MLIITKLEMTQTLKVCRKISPNSKTQIAPVKSWLVFHASLSSFSGHVFQSLDHDLYLTVCFDFSYNIIRHFLYYYKLCLHILSIAELNWRWPSNNNNAEKLVFATFHCFKQCIYILLNVVSTTAQWGRDYPCHVNW